MPRAELTPAPARFGTLHPCPSQQQRILVSSRASPAPPGSITGAAWSRLGALPRPQGHWVTPSTAASGWVTLHPPSLGPCPVSVPPVTVCSQSLTPLCDGGGANFKLEPEQSVGKGGEDSSVKPARTQLPAPRQQPAPLLGEVGTVTPGSPVPPARVRACDCRAGARCPLRAVPCPAAGRRGSRRQ